MRTWLRRLALLASVALSVVALLDQLGRRPADRTWYGSVLGVPYDFRWPAGERWRARCWNPADERIVTPQVWGVGWTVNLYQLQRRLKLLIA